MTKKRQNPLTTLADAVGTAIVAIAIVPVLIVQTIVSQ